MIWGLPGSKPAGRGSQTAIVGAAQRAARFFLAIFMPFYAQKSWIQFFYSTYSNYNVLPCLMDTSMVVCNCEKK